jgi:hypothetical protein
MADANSIATQMTADSRSPKPMSVHLAVRLFWIYIGLGALECVLEPFISGKIEDTPLLLAVLFFVTPILIAAATLLSRGYGWVRHVWAVLCLLQLPYTYQLVTMWLAGPAIVAIGRLVGEILVVATVVLLYLPTSRQWFRTMRSARRGRL